MSQLFSSFKLREITFKNRIFVSPMCQYSSENGVPNNWHMVHLGSRAVGGAALVLVEATGVSPEGRISPDDMGIWNENQAAAFKPITQFIKSQGAVPGIQLAHAGRKASTISPWKKDLEGKGWTPLAPSALAFNGTSLIPKEMTLEDIEQVAKQFEDATKRSLVAGFEVIEIHMAHGYLLHQFLSPISNKRNDKYGVNLEGRMAFPLEVARRVRALIPNHLPLFVRISATDWVDGGWNLEQSIKFCNCLKKEGVDFIDCSTGGNIADVKIPVGPGYQVPFAEKIKAQVGIATGAVGMITDPHQAEEILATTKADAILLARELLRDPYWPLHAAHALKVNVAWPKQYERAKPHS